MQQVIEEEQKKPLQVSKEFITSYEAQERKEEERLDHEVERHIDVLKRLRNKVRRGGLGLGARSFEEGIVGREESDQMEQANVLKKRNQIDGLRTTGDAGFLFLLLLVLGFLLWGPPPHSHTHSFGSVFFLLLLLLLLLLLMLMLLFILSRFDSDWTSEVASSTAFKKYAESNLLSLPPS